MWHLADVQVMVCPDFMDQFPCTVLVNCRWSRRSGARGSGPDRQRSPPAEFFFLLQFQFVQGLPGGGSVWRAAQMIRDPRQTPPWHRWSKARWSAWRGVWMWGTIRQGNALRAGGRRPLRWTGPTALQSPLCGKRRGCHPHAHTRTQSAQHPRARNTHVTHLRLARVPVALCRYVYAWRAQQCTAQL